ncbi:MAG: uroporphyrinogen-III C-methyltransferase [Thermoplasmata archaeon]
MSGIVYLVGAGPGDPELLTLKALNILKKGDIVMYDYLINKNILKLLPPQVKKIAVGKNKKEDTDVQQDRINKLLVKYAKEGKKVVRLKSGDPFLFGRGGEEIEYLKSQKVRFRVIPGISSSIGVPTYVGLPLTHRNFSSSIMIISGQLRKGNTLDWDYIAKFKGTLVILMGAKNLEDIIASLLKNGKDADTPICLIRNGTLKSQMVLKGSLQNIVKTAKANNIKAPLITVIGSVVNLL